jgi:ABC-2 type transport system ATP-binding protein
MINETLLELQNLRKDYDEKRVLHGIRGSLSSGHVALLGPNGAGKTTLLSILSTRTKPSSGTFLLNGVSLETHSSWIRSQIGLVGHQSLLVRGLTLKENLEMYAGLYSLTDTEERIQTLAERFALVHRLDSPVEQLSRGMVQRAALMRALLHDPCLLLLDEPFTGLDPRSRQYLVDLLDEWKGGHRLVIFTTHDLEQASINADRFVILARGRVERKHEGTLALNELKEMFAEVEHEA